MKHGRSLWWTKRKEQISSFFVSERKEEDVKEKGKKRNKIPRAETSSGKVWKMALSSFDFGAELVLCHAAAGRLEPKGEAEVPKIIIVSDAVRGTKVDLDGKGLQEKHAEERSSRREREVPGIESIPGNEGRIAHAWVNVRGGLRIFSVYFWHSEGWTPRNEALLEAVRSKQEQQDTRG